MLEILLAMLLSASATPADESDKELIDKYARKMWAAFQCDQYATIETELEKGTDFFDIGYGSGSATFYLIDQNRITLGELVNEDLLPQEVLVRSLPRPSIEFALGRIYEEASGEAFAKIIEDLPQSPDRFQAMKNRARRLFEDENCRFLASD